MAGGTFTPGVEKERAGLYMNFTSKAKARTSQSVRGVCAIPVIMDWGPEHTLISISKDSEAKTIFGRDLEDPKMLHIREARKNAKTVLAYRVNKGEKAKGSWGTDSGGTSLINVEAVYSGKRGNDITIQVVESILEDESKVVRTIVDGVSLHEQTVSSPSELKNNEWVIFTPAETTTEIILTAGVNLTGGTDGETTVENYTNFLSEVEVNFVNTVGFINPDKSANTTFVSFIKRLREDEGKKIQGVLAGTEGLNYEGISNIINGVKLEDGTELTPMDTVAWFSGISAGVKLSESNTYAIYEGAVDVVPRLKDHEIKMNLKNGNIVFFFDGKAVRVEKDINTLTKFTDKKNYRFSKNRTIRTLDTIGNDLAELIADKFIGKVNCDPDGFAILKGAISSYMTELQKGKAIINFLGDTDIIIDEELSVDDSVYVTLGVQPADSMEKFYINVEVR